MSTVLPMQERSPMPWSSVKTRMMLGRVFLRDFASAANAARRAASMSASCFIVEVINYRVSIAHAMSFWGKRGWID